MSFPMINFKFANTKVGEELLTIVENKLSSLDKFIGDKPAICEVEFEIITNNHRQQGKIYRVEVNLEVGGKLYRADATEESFERSIDEVRSELWQEMQTSRGKRETLIKRGARRMKEMMRWRRV